METGLDYIDSLRDWLNTLDPAVAGHVVQILRLCVWLALVAVIFTPLEWIFALHPKKVFRKGMVTDLGYYFLNNLVPGLLLSFPLAVVAWFARHAVPAGFLATVGGMPLWARLSAAMVVGEVGSYWGHRWTHEIPLLWRFHAIHHSAEEVDYLTTTRAHPVDMVFTRLCELTPMYVLGLASPMSLGGSVVPMLVIVIGTFWGFFIHANVKWRFGPLEWVVSTPAFHHWHHTNDGPEVINKNYAPMLPWVDWVFGTMYLPKDKQPERYGIDEKISPVLMGQLVEPFMVWRKAEPVTQSIAHGTVAAGEADGSAAEDAVAVGSER